MYVLNDDEMRVASVALRVAAKKYDDEADASEYANVKLEMRSLATRCRKISAAMDDRQDLKQARR